MKRILGALAAFLLAAPIAALAQGEYNHAEVGVFGDYFRVGADSQTALRQQNLLGVGGRVGFAVHPNIKLEVDGAYDFEHSTIDNFCDNLIPPNCGSTRVGLRATHFSVGPKFQFGRSSPIRAFVFAKGRYEPSKLAS